MVKHKLRKIKRIKIKDTVSAGVGSVLPGNAARPEVTLNWFRDLGVLVHNLKNDEEFVIPWSNVVEVVLETEEADE